ncbi:hypothetical protein [Siphonobacter sp. SORGH_AS_0500]|uniref:hypothetical protein n=1 Tax=Siphonobacter sp. SORGH_AS_0500 TaxID=1864824 RepID=UPI0028575EEF|nr:hypothetical protein [Siphonobacter sp. SORGH_AS_0500]MDR6195609.1 hypothetical protein [Siphonobacter sp. SORGH_AS_0500]
MKIKFFEKELQILNDSLYKYEKEYIYQDDYQKKIRTKLKINLVNINKDRLKSSLQIYQNNNINKGPSIIYYTLAFMALIIVAYTIGTSFSNLYPTSSNSTMLSQNSPSERPISITVRQPIVPQNEINRAYRSLESKLEKEINRLNTQATINILCSFFLAFSLIAYLGYSAIQNDFSVKIKWDNYLIYYLPKLTICITFSTLFVYFTKLYKANIIDVKYYQNELTNITLKKIAFKISVENLSNTQSIIDDLLKTDRNNILPIDSTTVELERMKIENDATKSQLQTLNEWFGNLLSKKD